MVSSSVVMAGPYSGYALLTVEPRLSTSTLRGGAKDFTCAALVHFEFHILNTATFNWP